jgi:acyl carrier protein
MSDTQDRLIRCFSGVFPDLAAEQIPRASMATVGAWDSLATVMLLSVVEEEFKVDVRPDDLPDLTSFDLILDYLNETPDGR